MAKRPEKCSGNSSHPPKIYIPVLSGASSQERRRELDRLVSIIVWHVVSEAMMATVGEVSPWLTWKVALQIGTLSCHNHSRAYFVNAIVVITHLKLGFSRSYWMRVRRVVTVEIWGYMCVIWAQTTVSLFLVPTPTREYPDEMVLKASADSGL